MFSRTTSHITVYVAPFYEEKTEKSVQTLLKNISKLKLDIVNITGFITPVIRSFLVFSLKFSAPAFIYVRFWSSVLYTFYSSSKPLKVRKVMSPIWNRISQDYYSTCIDDINRTYWAPQHTFLVPTDRSSVIET